MRLLLVRHAESVGNAERRLQGQGDFPLSERGEDQASRLAEHFAQEPRIAAVYASPLLRTTGTAQRIAARLGLTVNLLPEVKEYDFGEVTGLTWNEVAERYPNLIAAVRARTPEYPSYPGEEGREAFRRRVCTALWQLGGRYAGDEQVVIVTHAGPILVFCLEVLGLPYQRPAPFALDNGSITVVDIHMGAGTLVSTNDVCHLKGVETPRGSTGPQQRPASAQ